MVSICGFGTNAKDENIELETWLLRTKLVKKPTHSGVAQAAVASTKASQSVLPNVAISRDVNDRRLITKSENFCAAYREKFH